MSNLNIPTNKSTLVGFKRYLQHQEDDQSTAYKQFKPNENVNSDSKLRDLGIPPLLLASRNSNQSIPSLDYEASLNQMKEMYLLKQLKQIQYYTDFLKLKSLADLAAVQAAQQEQISRQFQQENFAKSFLVASRDNSANSCASFSTSASASISPQRNLSLFNNSPIVSSPVQMEIPKFADVSSPNPAKKMVKVSACKNYIALLCTGFARSMLVSDSSSALHAHLSLTIQHKRASYSSLFEVSDEKLREEVLDYIQKDICGKRVKKTNKGRDFKVRNTEELEVLLNVKQGDDEMTCFRKEVLKEMVEFFFVSNCYEDWLEKGMINEANKSFFLKNKMEIQKKFANPISYKPHFDYSAGAEF